MASPNGNGTGAATPTDRVQPRPPKTSGYRPTILGLPAWAQALDGEIFTLTDVDQMRRDYQVSLCLSYKTALLASAEFEISAERDEVRAFVAKNLERFWRHSLPVALESHAYGHTGSEIIRREHKGKVWFRNLKCLHPRDLTVNTRKGRLDYINVRNVQDDGSTTNVKLFPARRGRLAEGIWFVHQGNYSPWYGMSGLYGAWWPWRIKTMPDGARDVFFKWLYKHAYSGMLVRHPNTSYLDEDSGTVVESQDDARQMGEMVKTGANFTLSSERDEHGQYRWLIEQFATVDGEADGVIRCLDKLDVWIQRGILIPDEVLTHDGNTGGYSRSRVAVSAFFLGAEQSLNYLLETYDDQELRPLVRFNFSRHSDYEIKPRPLRPPDEPQQQQGQGGPSPKPPLGLPNIPGWPPHLQNGNQQRSGDPRRFSLPTRLSAGPRSYASTQFDLPKAIADKIKQLAADIDLDDLAEEGVEKDSHITLKYGLHNDDPARLRELLAGQGPISVTLGATSVFSHDEQDVLKIDVWGQGIFELNRLITESLANTETWPVYKPHATVAYLKPGKGEKYAGDTRFDGMRITFDALAFSPAEGQKVTVPLAGCAPTCLSAHAPEGGVTIAGKHFPGGEFIPHEAIAAASPEENDQLQRAGAASGELAWLNRIPAEQAEMKRLLWLDDAKSNSDVLNELQTAGAIEVVGRLATGVIARPKLKGGALWQALADYRGDTEPLAQDSDGLNHLFDLLPGEGETIHVRRVREPDAGDLTPENIDDEQPHVKRLKGELYVWIDPHGPSRIVTREWIDRQKQRFQEKTKSIKLSSQHAPAGGVDVQGKHYEGGEFIPQDVIEKATKEEREAIEGKGDDLKDRILGHLKKTGGFVDLRELHHAMGHSEYDPHDPLSNPVNAALKELDREGKINTRQPRFGGPRFGWKEPEKQPDKNTTEQSNADRPKQTEPRPKQRDLFSDLEQEEAKPADGEPDGSEPPGPSFTGESTDELGHTYHWVDGKRVASQEEVEQAEEQESPREAAARESTSAKESEYAYARESAVPNAGEDVLGSARHIRNAWRGLAEAEKDGTAAELVTREHLFKNEPLNLLARVDEKTALSSLAMHLAMQKFPASPLSDYNRHASDEAKKKDRETYYKVYQELKDHAERLAEQEADPFKSLDQFNAAVGNRIKELRNENPFDAVANTLVHTFNKTRVRSVPSWYGKADAGGQLYDFVGRVKHKYGEPSPEMLASVSEHVKDVMEGHSFNKTFGTVQGGKKEFNPADLYVKHAERKGGRVIDAKTVKAGTDFMLNNLKMRGVQYGNSVSDDERQHHLRMAAEAFADLADVVGLPDETMSMNGQLAIAFGARGKGTALAHYEPGPKVINLTRKGGVGSLAHEWGHFFDHVVAGGDGDRYFSEAVNTKERVKNDRGEWEWRDVQQSDLRKAFDQWREATKTSGFDRRLSAELSQWRREKRMSDKKADYWRSRREVFARCFERYVNHKLAADGRRNTYLSGMEEDAYWARTLGAKFAEPPKVPGMVFWPTDEEVKAMAPAFDAIFSAYRDLLVAGNPEPVTEDEAYEQAIDHLVEHGRRRAATEAVPFSVQAGMQANVTFYAALRQELRLSSGQWDESKVVRGQPDNAGQFARKGASSTWTKVESIEDGSKALRDHSVGKAV